MLKKRRQPRALLDIEPLSDVRCKLEIVEELAMVDDRPLVTVSVPGSHVQGEHSVSVRRALYEAGFRPGDVVELRVLRRLGPPRSRVFNGL